jgi:exonuclease III
MLRFLFWNLNRNPLESTVANLCYQHDVDVLILAECVVPPARLLRELYDRNGVPYHFTHSLCERLVVYTRFSGKYARPVYEDGHSVSIRRLRLPARPEMLLVAAHLPSKLWWSEESQSLHCPEIARTIRECEIDAAHTRTVLVGDLNMNPFETGVVASTGFNATMARPVALRGSRKVQDKEYLFFYNPMWGHFGHTTDGPPGTYYHTRGEHVVYFWNVFDHVLLRPEMLQYFKDDGLRILDSDETTSLVSHGGLPSASDHLPIVFELEI